MQEVRCVNCNRLIFKANLTRPYAIQYKCPKCKQTIFIAESQDFEPEPIEFKSFKLIKPIND
jgi:phage FluMu protein Com